MIEQIVVGVIATVVGGAILAFILSKKENKSVTEISSGYSNENLSEHGNHYTKERDKKKRSELIDRPIQDIPVEVSFKDMSDREQSDASYALPDWFERYLQVGMDGHSLRVGPWFFNSGEAIIEGEEIAKISTKDQLNKGEDVSNNLGIVAPFSGILCHSSDVDYKKSANSNNYYIGSDKYGPKLKIYPFKGEEKILNNKDVLDKMFSVIYAEARKNQGTRGINLFIVNIVIPSLSVIIFLVILVSIFRWIF